MVAITDRRTAQSAQISDASGVRVCVWAHLRGKLDQEVVICSEGADAGALADGRGQGFDLIEAAVELVQHGQPAERGR